MLIHKRRIPDAIYRFPQLMLIGVTTFFFLCLDLLFAVFAALVTTYVDAIRNGAVPCVENAIKSLALIENSKAVETAIQLYHKEMGCGIKLPTKDDKTLNDYHFNCLQNAVKHFLEKAVMDEDNEFQRN